MVAVWFLFYTVAAVFLLYNEDMSNQERIISQWQTLYSPGGGQLTYLYCSRASFGRLSS